MNAKRFFQAVLPSMLSQLLNGFFIIVDGFFIGGAMGDNGLAAINVAWPVVALILSTGMGLGTGGAVQVAICRGKGDLEGAGRARGNALLAMAAASLILLTGLWFSYPVLLPWVGAAGELLPLAEEYLRVVILVGAVQLFSSGLLPLLRGSGRPVGAMAVMVLGLLANIFLDWLFVWVLRWGMVGAAAATVIAQFIGIPISLTLLLRDKSLPCRRQNFAVDLRLVGRMMALGASPFGLSLSVSAVILINNLQALRYGGQQAVAVYAILSYVFGSLHPLISGVGDGVQPLLSYCHGARDQKNLAFMRRAAFAMALGCSAVLGVGAWLLRWQAGGLFGAGPEATAGAARGLVWYCLALPFFAAARICCSYFCATAQARLASLLAFAEPLVAQPLCLLVLPAIFGVEGIWAACFGAYLLLAAAGLGLLGVQLAREPG